ncbi:MAG: hypothetical protein P1V97_12735 [Planctomycetota bacterium]|nr:hypothetical protein [Planctomycetota bacterium]
MTESMDWYLGSKKKPVGPMTAAKVHKYIEKGKTSSKTRIRRGEDGEWILLYEEPYFQDALESASNDGVAEAEDEDMTPFASDVMDAVEEAPQAQPVAPAKKAPKPKKRAAPSVDDDGEKKGLAAFFAGTASEPSYDPGYRFEKRDVWRAFSAGMTKTRVLFAFIILIAVSVIGGVFAGIAGIGAMIHPVAALIAMGLGFAVMISVANMGLGALSYHTRMALEGETLGVKDCFRFAFQNYAPLTMVPFVSTLLPMIPLILLVILAFIAKIPYVGPVGTGLVFVIHILLGGLTVLFLTMAGVSWVFTPVLVAFGQDTVKGTLKALLGFLKTAAVRFIFRSFWPSLGFSGFAFLVMFIGNGIVMVPVVMTLGASGGDTLKTMMSNMPGMGRRPYRGRSSNPFAKGRYGSARTPSYSRGSSFFGGGGDSAPTVIGLSGSPRKVEFADFVSNPSAYAGQQIWFTASWRVYKNGKVELSGRKGDVKGRFGVHVLGRRKSGLFLGQVSFWARVTVSAKINKAGDYDYTYGQLLAVKLDTAKNAVRVYPTAAEIRVEEQKIAREKAAREARKRKDQADREAVVALLNAALNKEDLDAAQRVLKDSRWRKVNNSESYKLEGKVRALAAKLRTGKILIELNALIAKSDFVGASNLLSFRNKGFMSLSRDQQSSLRSTLKTAKDARTKELSKPIVVKLDDGTEIQLDFSKALYVFHPKSVTFVERMTPNKKAKKPFKLKIEFLWVHSGMSTASIDGGGAHKEKGFRGTEVKKTMTSVEIIIDQTRIKKGLIKFDCR